MEIIYVAASIGQGKTTTLIELATMSCLQGKPTIFLTCEEGSLGIIRKVGELYIQIKDTLSGVNAVSASRLIVEGLTFPKPILAAIRELDLQFTEDTTLLIDGSFPEMHTGLFDFLDTQKWKCIISYQAQKMRFVKWVN